MYKSTKLILGDCVEKLKELDDDSIDTCITDPPYGIAFMNRPWDKILPPVEAWKEVLRVLKPGAWCMVVCSPRQDVLSRQMISLEDAGFNVGFSSIYWTHAQGFPKAHNIGKAMDKKFGNKREFEGSYGGAQMKPAVEVIIVAMKPMNHKTYIDQALNNGKGITWLDDCRVPYADKDDREGYEKSCSVNGVYETGLTWAGKKVLDVPKAGRRTADFFGEVGEGKNDSWSASPTGRFPANLLVSDEVLDDGKSHPGNRGSFSRYFSLDTWAEKNLPFLIVPKPSSKEKNAGCEGMEVRETHQTKLAVKCKKCGKYPASSNPQNRCECEKPEWEGAKQRNSHPTVKPIKLMSYLITMTTREGDVVLDPFMGSGTTGCAAVLLGREFIGIEMEEEYIKIAEERINYWSKVI